MWGTILIQVKSWPNSRSCSRPNAWRSPWVWIEGLHTSSRLWSWPLHQLSASACKREWRWSRAESHIFAEKEYSIQAMLLQPWGFISSFWVLSPVWEDFYFCNQEHTRVLHDCPWLPSWNNQAPIICESTGDAFGMNVGWSLKSCILSHSERS